MLAGVYSAASAMKTAEFQQDVISTNLAHLNVPGFRRSMMTVSTFKEELSAQQNDAPGYGNTVESLAIDFTGGPMAPTGRSLDVAIGDAGFFAVQGPKQTLYTRNGVFQLGPGGQLVGNHGMPILGNSGPITIPEDTNPSDIVIAKDGSITVGENQIGQLQLVRFENNQGLKQVGTTLFAAESTAVTSDEPVTVMQGVREQSNVQPVDELVAMIVAMRYHEASQRTLKSLDNAIQLQTNPQG